MGKKFGVKGLVKRLFIFLMKSFKMINVFYMNGKKKIGCINFYLCGYLYGFKVMIKCLI